MNVAQSCVESSKHLQTIATSPWHTTEDAQLCKRLRDYATTLTREPIIEDMEDKAQSRDVKEDWERQAKKELILVKLKCLIRGNTNDIRVMEARDGSLTDDTDEMVGNLRSHWSAVFKKNIFVEEGCGFGFRTILIVVTDPLTLQRHTDVSKKNTFARLLNTQTIPDQGQMVYLTKPGNSWGELWWKFFMKRPRTCKRNGTCERLYTLKETNESHCSFNLALLCCLPKKPSGVDGKRGAYYKPKDTRPLSIVNTDKRLIANACRICLEPIGAFTSAEKEDTANRYSKDRSPVRDRSPA